MRATWFALLAGACYSPTPPAGAPCGDGQVCPTGQQCIAGICGGVAVDDADVSVDTLDIDAAPLCATWMAQHFDPCLLPAPLGDLNLTNALANFSWNTSSGELKGRMNTTIPVITSVLAQQDGPDVLIASVENFTLQSGTLDVSGSRPLLIAVNGTATISGTISVGASLGVAGPGGFASATGICAGGPTGNAGQAGTPATGGGGGAHQGAGARGGNTGGTGGMVVTPSRTIRGGCAGGSGGASDTAVLGPRGAGGGALQITAREAIVVASGAALRAPGGGGGGGRAGYGGGGGGGAGGYIGLDAPMVSIMGSVVANGGSGGGGASDVANGVQGNNGGTGTTAAAGGAGATASNVGTCGNGGNGAAGGTLGGATGGSSACGGGGGGGAAGYIYIWSPNPVVSGVVSPPVTGGP